MNSRAARRCPSSEGWKPSAAKVERSLAAGWSKPSSNTTPCALATMREAALKSRMPFSTRARERGRRSRKREMSG